MRDAGSTAVQKIAFIFLPSRLPTDTTPELTGIDDLGRPHLDVRQWDTSPEELLTRYSAAQSRRRRGCGRVSWATIPRVDPPEVGEAVAAAWCLSRGAPLLESG